MIDTTVSYGRLIYLKQNDPNYVFTYTAENYHMVVQHKSCFDSLKRA